MVALPIDCSDVDLQLRLVVVEVMPHTLQGGPETLTVSTPAGAEGDEPQALLSVHEVLMV